MQTESWKAKLPATGNGGFPSKLFLNMKLKWPSCTERQFGRKKGKCLGEKTGKARKFKLVLLSNHPLKAECLPTFPKMDYDAMCVCVCVFEEKDGRILNTIPLICY